MMNPHHLLFERVETTTEFGINPLDSVKSCKITCSGHDGLFATQCSFRKISLFALRSVLLVDFRGFTMIFPPLFPSPNPPSHPPSLRFREDTAFKLAQEITSSADEVVQSFRCAPGLLSAMIIIAQCAAEGGWEGGMDGGRICLIFLGYN